MLREILQAHHPIIYEDSSVCEIVDKLEIYKFPALPILNQNHYPIGIVSENDIIKWSTDYSYTKEFGSMEVSRFSSVKPLIISVNTSVDETLNRMITENATVATIVEDDSYLGLIQKIHILQYKLSNYNNSN